MKHCFYYGTVFMIRRNPGRRVEAYTECIGRGPD
jgi:hypothetical protein